MSRRRSDSSDSDAMDVDDPLFDNTQATEPNTPSESGTPVVRGRGGGGGGKGPPENLTDIYARQYEEMQQILQEGAATTEAIERVGEVVRESAVLCKQEKKVRESLYGASVLSVCSQISKAQAQSLDTNLSSFDVQCFADGILNHINDEDNNRADWSILAKRASRMFKRAPVFSYMYGSFKPTELPRKEPKERVKRQTNRVAAAEKKQPEKVSTVTATEEGNDKAVQHMKKVLKHYFKHNGNRPIGFFDCVLDPNSFHRTVENIFHISFLMKNNFCAVKQENGGLPYIHFVNPAQVNELNKGKKSQCIVSISKELWETLVEVFGITEPMVPPMA